MSRVIEFCQSPANPFEKLVRQEQLLHCTSIHAYLNNPRVRVNVEVKTTVKQLSFCSDRILTCRINSICSPAKVGLVVIDLITSPVVSWRGWETPPSPAPRLSCHSLLNHGWVKTSLSVVACCSSSATPFVYVWWM